MKSKNKIISYLVTAFIALAIAFIVLMARNTFSNMVPEELLIDISDAFMISGIFVCGAGGIVWAAGLGTFDMLGYSVKLVLDTAFSFNKDWKKKENFYEYRERKSKKKAEFKNLLFVGFSMLAVSFYAIIIMNLTF